MSHEKQLFEFLKEFSLFAGELSHPYYGKIASTTKQVRTHDHVRESPVTAMDHGIQELLLAELIRKKWTHIAFNGEEDTHLKVFLSNDFKRDFTLHCDPIDGTDSFAKGNAPYATSYALSRYSNGKNDFFSTVIYSPLEKEMYWAFEDEVSRHARSKNVEKTFNSRRIFSDTGKARMKELEYKYAFHGSAHLGIVDVVLGRLGAIILSDVLVHDALIPFAFAKNYGIIPTDQHGTKMKKFELEIEQGQFKRIPKLCYFANKEIEDELIPILSNSKNLL